MGFPSFKNHLPSHLVTANMQGRKHTTTSKRRRRYLWITDGESDDLAALLLVLLLILLGHNISIPAILVLNDRQKKDGWNRFYWVNKLLDIYRLQNPSSEPIHCEECLNIDEAESRIEVLLKIYPDCYDIFSLGSVLPFAGMQTSDFKGTPINVWTYGSVNIRWAASHMSKQLASVEQADLIPSDPYEILAQMFNAPDARLKFHIFETFGAYGPKSSSTINIVSCPELYDWIRDDTSDYALFLRDAIIGWNTVSYNRIVAKIGADLLQEMLSQVDPSIVLSFQTVSDYISRIYGPLQRLVESNPKLKMDVDILVYMAKCPLQMVCADVGLAAAATVDGLDAHFIPCTIGFGDGSNGGKRFTTPKFSEEATPATSTYFTVLGDRQNVDIFQTVTDSILSVFAER